MTGKFIQLKHSKKAVRRAGDYLIGNSRNDTLQLLNESLEILANWRSSHVFPMRSMAGYFRRKAYIIDPDAVIARRLKRTPSIISKLFRQIGMKLDRMEDIGGIRIIVDTKINVYKVRDLIVKGRTRNILHRERDYISSPKSSGYRGIHLIYKYRGSKIAYLDHAIELQIRSKVQHSWATAVEVVGAFTGQALKSSRGRDAWLKFFKLASIAFEDIESRKLKKNWQTKERLELLRYIKRLGVLPKLRAFTVSTKHIDRHANGKGQFFLLILDTEKSTIRVRRFSNDKFTEATEQYNALEKDFESLQHKDVVLVSAESIKELKKAYPNYFADTTAFARNIEKIISTNDKQILAQRMAKRPKFKRITN